MNIRYPNWAARALSSRVIVFGDHRIDWKKALSPASDVWHGVKCVSEVLQFAHVDELIKHEANLLRADLKRSVKKSDGIEFN